MVKAHVLGGLAGRVTVQAGNFFELVPPADALLLKNVLHDWDDGPALRILKACRAAMSSLTRLLIIEMVVGSQTDFAGLFYDLHMQVLLGGREWTEEEFRLLLAKAGLSLRRIVPTKSPLKILEASLS